MKEKKSNKTFSLFDFEKKVLQGKFSILNNLNIPEEFYLIEQLNDIERDFLKVFLVCLILLGVFWIL